MSMALAGLRHPLFPPLIPPSILFILLIFLLPHFNAHPSLGQSSPPSSPSIGASRQGQFLLITDFHIDPKYDRHGDRTAMCHRAKEEEKPNETPKKGGESDQQETELGAYGERTCDSPPALVEYMVDEAKRQMPKPDFIIWTGDTPAHVEYTDAEFTKTMADATKLMREKFPGTLIIPVLGNHDMSPPNDFPDDDKREQSLYSDIFHLWQDWIGEEAKADFLRGGYYRFHSPVDGADYLVLNTNMYYSINRAIQNFTHPDDPTGQFQFLERQLELVRRKNGKIHIVSHLPPGAYEWDSYGTEWNPIMPPNYNRRLVDIFIKYAPWIGWMLFGHLHTDTFRILKDSSGKPVQRMFLSPAVTPMFELNNPAFRLFEYDLDSAQILDIKTFYVDLDVLNRDGPGKVRSQLEYSMATEYSLKSFDAEGMNDLWERMAANDTIFDKYILHNKVMHTKANSNGPDRRIHLCVIGNVDLDQLEKCTSAISAAWSTRTAPMFLAIFTVSILVFPLLRKAAHHLP